MIVKHIAEDALKATFDHVNSCEELDSMILIAENKSNGAKIFIDKISSTPLIVVEDDETEYVCDEVHTYEQFAYAYRIELAALNFPA